MNVYLSYIDTHRSEAMLYSCCIKIITEKWFTLFVSLYKPNELPCFHCTMKILPKNLCKKYANAKLMLVYAIATFMRTKFAKELMQKYAEKKWRYVRLSLSWNLKMEHSKTNKWIYSFFIIDFIERIYCVEKFRKFQI